MSRALLGLLLTLALAAPGCGADDRQHAGEVAELADLPLIEVPAVSPGSDALAPLGSDTLAFTASGDGGWARLDRSVAAALAQHGVPTVGLDTLRYYWKPRSPEESARALERILRAYLARWHAQRILLVGYSRGAGVLPFMASRLPADLRERVDLVAFLGLEPMISFQFHFADWFRDTPTAGAIPVEPEVEKLRGLHMLCIYGADEPDSLCPKLPPGLVVVDRRAGGHHFDGDYAAIAQRILREAAGTR